MERNIELDFIKAFAIYLVILGHTIQYFASDCFIFLDPIGKAIYLFHMPLFFFISGFLFNSTKSISFISFVTTRIKRLLIPKCVWGVLLVASGMAMDSLSSFPLSMPAFFAFAVSSYWFIWVLLYNTIIVKLICFLCAFYNSRILLIVFILLSCLSLFILPDIPHFIYQNYLRVFFPFFCLGFICRYLKLYERIVKSKVIFICSVLLFCYCFQTCEPNNFKYGLQPLSVFMETFDYVWKKEFFLLFAGFSGIAIILYVSRRIAQSITKNYFVQFVGKSTFSIYMIQGVLFDSIIKGFHFQLHSYALYILISFGVLFLCVCLNVLLKKNNHLCIFLLGNYQKDYNENHL